MNRKHEVAMDQPILCYAGANVPVDPTILVERSRPRLRGLVWFGLVSDYQITQLCLPFCQSFSASLPAKFLANLIAGPGQRAHEIEVGDDFTLVPAAEEILKKLAVHVNKKTAAA